MAEALSAAVQSFAALVPELLTAAGAGRTASGSTCQSLKDQIFFYLIVFVIWA